MNINRLTFKTQPIISGILFLIISMPAWSETFEVAQKDKKFTKTILNIKVGDTVKFINQDSFFHNVFSLSDIKFFDLGSFPKGEFKEVVFDEAGVIEVECAIHPNMFMKIEVQ